MQKALLPYKLSLPIYPQDNISSSSMHNQNNVSNYVRAEGKGENLKEVVRENAVIVLARRGCCMSHVVRILLQGLGVNPAIYEVDEQDENDVIRELEVGQIQFPAVFIGGKYFGGLDRIMATHITGELTPVLKLAGALWL